MTNDPLVAAAMTLYIFYKLVENGYFVRIAKKPSNPSLAAALTGVMVLILRPILKRYLVDQQVVVMVITALLFFLSLVFLLGMHTFLKYHLMRKFGYNGCLYRMPG